MSINSVPHFGAGTPPRVLKRSRRTPPIKQESEASSSTQQPPAQRIKREGSPVIKKEESRSPSPVLENPLSVLRNQVRDVLRRFGNEKTEFPKGNSANARGKQRPEVQNAISEASRVLNRRPSVELDQEVATFRAMASEEAPGKASKNWFNRDSLGLVKGSWDRNRYHGGVRAQAVIPQAEQDLSRQFDDQITQQIQSKPLDPRGYGMDQTYLERSYQTHRTNLGKVYEASNRQGLEGTPQEQQAYLRAEHARRRWVHDRVVATLPGNPVNDFFHFQP